MATRGGVIGVALALVMVVGCSSDKVARSEANSVSSPPPPATPSTDLPDATPVNSGTRVQYLLHTDDGVTVRYTILAPDDDPLVQRVQAYHDNVRETRPLRMVLAEVENRSTTDFEAGDLEITEGDGDKVHFLEAWLYVGQWRRALIGESDSPFYMEGFDLDNELLDRGIVEAGTTSTTVLAAEDFVDTVRSVTARDRSGDMIPLTRVS
jgi:hypothetical protein